MTVDETLKAVLDSLIERLDLDSSTRARLVEEIRGYAQEDDPGRPVVALVAVNLDRYYTSLEASFEAVVHSFDGDMPTGSGWHQSLLHQMEQPGEARPPLVKGATRSALVALLRFRHFLRHSYAVDLDWRKLRPLACSLENTNSLVAEDLSAFRVYVASCLTRLSGTDLGA